MSLATFVGCSKHSDAGFRPYGVQRATLHFQFLGSVRGVEDVFIDSFGQREARYEHSELIDSGGFQQHFGYNFRIGSHVTIVDSQHHLVREITDHYFDSLYSLGSNYPTPDQAAANALARTLFHPIGDTSILGLRCTIYQLGVYPTYAYVWRGIIVGRQVLEAKHPNEQRLVSIDTTTPIDPQRFVAPPDFRVMRMPPPGSAPRQ